MLSIISLFFWTILAGCVAAPTLSLLGGHLATRDRSMQTLCVGQGAMVGVLLGMGILLPYENPILTSVGPFLFAITCSCLTWIATDLIVANKAASKNTFFAFVFALLLSVGSLVSALFPALESHMAQVYFGDLATLTILNSKICLAASTICLVVLLKFWKPISKESFEIAIFGDRGFRQGAWKVALLFRIISLSILCLSVQFLGFLFTIGMLFVSTTLMTFLRTKGLKPHLSITSLLAVLGTFFGFLLSLRFTRLPTVPTIIVVMCVLAVTVLILEKARMALGPKRVLLPLSEQNRSLAANAVGN